MKFRRGSRGEGGSEGERRKEMQKQLNTNKKNEREVDGRQKTNYRNKHRNEMNN